MQEYPKGLEFNYAVWLANTSIDLCNVPWNNDYRDIVRFDDQDALNDYITQRASIGNRITNVSYAKLNEPIMLNIPFNKAIKYNYLRASNPAQPIMEAGPDVARSFYYFITDVKYVAPNTTQITVQIDVWQSFGYGIKFGNCYVTRGHIGMANTKRMQNNGRDYLAIPEGLDTGGEYVVRGGATQPVMVPFGTDLVSILVSSTLDLEGDFGTSEAGGKYPPATGGTFSLLPSGATYYVFKNPASFSQYLTSIKTTPWAASGITSITLIPNIRRYWPTFTFNADGTPTKAPAGAPEVKEHNLMSNWRDSLLGPTNVDGAIPDKYRVLDKLKVYPYSVVEMTTHSGTPIVIKPESWNSDDAKVVEMASLIPPTQRIVFYPFGYNSDSSNDRDGGDYLDFTTMIQSLPTVAIVNNMSSNYLAANAHGIAYQRDAADWSQQKALAGASTAYDQATGAMGVMESLGLIQRNADIDQTILANRITGQSATVDMISAFAGGAAGGGTFGGARGAAGGAIAGGVDGLAQGFKGLIQQGANTEGNAIRNAAALAEMNTNIGQAGYVRDTNNDLAKFAARGDYETTIAGINAKIQDSKFVPPQTAGQVGGDTFNLVHLRSELALRFKTMDNAHIRSVGDYWFRYGYAVNQFTTPPQDLKCMTKFTYWKMAETYIIAAEMPESMKQSIRGLFEKGVTVWTNPDDIGNIELDDNDIIGGISL